MRNRIYKNISELVGNTPLLELTALEKKLGLPARLLAKLEYFNPAGSMKDRVALSIIEDAEKSGSLKKGGVIIEPTSGNTGVGLAALAASRGYHMIAVMPDSMSKERMRLLRAYGATLELTPASLGMQGSIARAEELAKENPGSIIAGQFVNPANPNIHRKSTGPEIYEDSGGHADFLIAGVGSGGSITGTGQYLKNRLPSIKIVAVEPASSPVLSGGKGGAHKIQGIGAGFVPNILDRGIIDEIIRVPDDAACETAATLAKTEGLLVGISSGAVVWGAVQLAGRPENSGKTLVLLLPDGGERYLSTGIYAGA